MFSRQLDSFSASVNLDYLWSCVLTDVLNFLVYTFYFNISGGKHLSENMALEVLNEVFERELPENIVFGRGKYKLIQLTLCNGKR